MRDFQKEPTETRLPDVSPQPHRGAKPDWLGWIKSGEAAVFEKLPEWSDFASFRKDLFSHKYIITTTSLGEKSLDYALNFLTPEQKRNLTQLWAKRNSDGDFETGGQLVIDGSILRVRPLGKPAFGGLKKISVHDGSRHGYLLDFSFLADGVDKLVPALEYCESVGLYVPDSCTIAAMSRNLLLIYSPAAFYGLQEMGPDVFDIYRCASLVFRLGRFEMFTYGTVADAYVYDVKAAYPSELARLHHAFPPYCVWEKWDGDYDKLKRDDLVYGFFYVDEYIPKGFVGVGSHRTYTLGGTKIAFPWGEACRWIGIEQYRLRRRLGLKPNILHGWLGFSKNPYYPFRRLSRKMWEGRKGNPELFKKLDTRMVGNFMACYWEIVDDGTVFGQLIRKPLETYCPIYAAAAVDSVLATMTAICCAVPPDKLYGVSIDGVQVGTKLKSTGNWGELELKHRGVIRKFTDHLGDIKGQFLWTDRFVGDHLELPRDSVPSLVSCFGHLGDLERQQKMFESRKGPAGVLKVPVGPKKRFPTDKIDYMKESAVSRAPSTLELPELYVGSWYEEDFMDLMEGER